MSAPAAAYRVLPYGRAGLLVEAPDAQAAAGLHEALRAGPLPGAPELIPAARSVLIRLPDAASAASVRERLHDLLAPLRAEDRAAAGPDARPSIAVTIEVSYDGADLADLSRELGLSEQEIVARHSGAAYRCAFCGFAPGFSYLLGLDPALHARRLAEPRVRVPAGSVAIAGEFSAVYPGPSPGGWRLLGHTDAAMWDLARPGPALAPPGAAVRFAPIRATARGSSAQMTQAAQAAQAAQTAQPPGRRGAPAARPRALEIVAVGAAATIQDQGRPGWAAVGVGRSGAFDRRAAALANRLVGNGPDAAVIELVLGGIAVRPRIACAIALVGAPCDAVVDGRPAAWGAPIAVPAGAVLRLGAPRSGLRSWLAVRGGIATPAALGSRSADSLGALGPDPLRPGDVLPIGSPPAAGVPGVDWTPPADPAGGRARIDPGPRLDWFDPATWGALQQATWSTRPDSDRVGIRLDGPALARIRGGELPSEGMVPGAIQVPPDGRPIIVGPDGPVTGGYPVIAVVREEDLGALAQLRPGDALRLTG